MQFRIAKLKLALILCAFLAVNAGNMSSEALGQLIGNRTVGVAPGFNQPRGAGTGATVGGTALGDNSPPSISGRFIRGNRSRNDFVGSNRTDQTGFVGSTQALGVGRVPSAVEGLRVQSPRAVNRPIPAQPSTGLYYPRLVLDTPVPSVIASDSQAETRAETLFEAVQDRVSRIDGANVSVVKIGGLAIARGWVKDARTAELIVTLLGFEPGIEQIKNEMRIASEH